MEEKSKLEMKIRKQKSLKIAEKSLTFELKI